MKILICGLPGSGKSTLAKPFAELIGGVWINADAIRERYNDWDFSTEGRERQAFRMSMIADGVVAAGRIAVCDFVCPTEETRKKFACAPLKKHAKSLPQILLCGWIQSKQADTTIQMQYLKRL